MSPSREPKPSRSWATKSFMRATMIDGKVWYGVAYNRARVNLPTSRSTTVAELEIPSAKALGEPVFWLAQTFSETAPEHFQQLQPLHRPALLEELR